MKIVVNRTDPQEGAAFAEEINGWIRQGYRVQGVNRNITRLKRGDSPVRAYTLRFDKARPNYINAFVDTPILDNAIPVGHCPGLWLYPEDCTPAQEGAWEQAVLTYDKVFIKTDKHLMRYLSLYVFLFLFEMYIGFRTVRKFYTPEELRQAYLGRGMMAVFCILVLIFGFCLVRLLWNRKCNALHRRYLQEAVEAGQPYVLPEQFRGLIYRKNLLEYIIPLATLAVLALLPIFLFLN